MENVQLIVKAAATTIPNVTLVILSMDSYMIIKAKILINVEDALIIALLVAKIIHFAH